MKTIQLHVTDEIYATVADLTHQAEQVYGQEMSINAIILTSLLRGLPSTKYELDNITQDERPKLRLVK